MPTPGIHASGEIRVGLALSGGMAKSVTHIGVMRALTEAGVGIDCITGTSGGSLVAGAYAGGVSLDHMETVASELGWSRLASIRLSKLGLASSKRIENLMLELVGEKQIESTPIPCGITVTDLVSGEGRLLTSGSIARAVRASCSIPQIYRPVVIDGNYYVDGAFSEYLPSASVRDLGAGFVIGAHFTGDSAETIRPGNLLQLSMQLTQLVSSQNLPASQALTDYEIVPPVAHFSSFDFKATLEMMDIGYECGKQHVPSLLAAIDEKQQRMAHVVEWLLNQA